MKVTFFLNVLYFLLCTQKIKAPYKALYLLKEVSGLFLSFFPEIEIIFLDNLNNGNILAKMFKTALNQSITFVEGSKPSILVLHLTYFTEAWIFNTVQPGSFTG